MILINLFPHNQRYPKNERGKKRKISDFLKSREVVPPQKQLTQADTSPDADLKYPIFWSEVYVQDKWIPIDAITLQVTATTQRDVEKFEPKGKQAEDKKLVMGYVVAYDSGNVPRIHSF